MKGSYHVRVENARVQFKLTVTRSLTLIRGMSATGKTTLVDLIAEHQANGPASGVTLSCERPCVVLSGKGWKADLATMDDSLVFIDEGNEFIRSKEFARAIRDSSNYYIINSREDLPMLPYSVEEIYELRNSTSRYPGVRKTYVHAKRMYASIPNVLNPQTVIVEDSNAGFEFFDALCRRSGIACVSAGGKSNVLAALRACPSERILVIADGAAFGPHMETVLELARRKGAGLFLPESFEWLILSSGLVHNSEIPSVLADPASYVESRQYFSWEQFFTSLLIRTTKGSYLQYGKSKLNPAYLNDRERSAIGGQLMQTGLPLTK